MTPKRNLEEQALIDLFAKRLKTTMENKPIIASDLAKLSGVSKSMISMYLNGNHEPGQTNVYKMARVLGVSPAWLMGLKLNPICFYGHDGNSLFSGIYYGHDG